MNLFSRNQTRSAGKLAIVLLLFAGSSGAFAAETVVSGVTEPFKDVTLGAPVAGTLLKRMVREGDFVQAGQVLVEMVKRQEELEVDRRKLVMDSYAELKAAKARVETFKADVESTRKLLETTRAISKDDLAKRELEYSLAVSEVERLEMTKSREAVEYEMAKEILKQKVLVAPMSGNVVEFTKDVGEECKPQEPVMRLVDTRQFYFVVNIEAKIGAALRMGQSIKVQVENGANVIEVPGTIKFISPVVDPASGLLKLKILCDNPDGKIKPGVSGTVKLTS